ncbi:brain-specific angiogenesis inhibitor 1-associated protein 2-like protein 1 isoform X2 [Lytechinus variegatus]|uniref:brain-specific angiogenesis inhibitor 1-associated protein 2-like protein 1 isoform X2 n=2 Tax=Lytechinus variegatus TaxID=7654 RepID=UPI001BB1E0FA|nr:brain-specific angiogenesis inhibitor 1-associated protein 2-like protein 1 isoform X2 [Lytechinus variegatus]
MATGDQLHRMTENVYRHTIEGFNPELRNLVTLGRAYEKALQSVSQAAKDYFNAIVAVGELASETKDSRQLGQSLLQIAETYRQIETEREITVHALRKELLHPLEGKLEQEWKNVLQVQKTYLSENKAKSEAVEKCRSEVKKLQKKTQKNHSEKYIEKEQRTAEELQLLTKQLHNFRSNGLREAWTEERRRYCYLVDRYCSLIKNNAAFFSKAQSVLHHRLPKWNESCDKSDKLPEECEDILSFDFSGPLETPLQVELRNSRRLYERNIMLAQNEERTKKSPQHEPTSPKTPNESDRPLSVDVEPPQQPPPPSSTGVTSSYSATLPNIKKLGSSTHPSVHQLPPFQTNQQQQMIPPMTQPTTPSPPQQPPQQQQQPLQQPPQTQVPPNLAGRHSKSVKSPHHLHAISQTMPRQTFMRRVSEAGDMMENEQKMPRVQAVYTHSATGENQLAFSEGDIIGLVGPKNNGWFYGHNYRTRRNGWFPITYTQPLADIVPKTNGTSNILNTKPVAASMDNLQSVGNDYPTPDYSGPGSPVTAASTLSLPQVGIAIPSTLSTPPTYTNPSASASNNNGVENGGVKPSGLLMTAPVGVVEGEERNNIQNQQQQQQQQQTGNSTFNTAVPTTKQSASIQPDVQLSQIQLSVPDENTNVPSPNNGDQGESNPFTKIQLRKTVTNDRSAPIIPRDYQLGEFARH